MAAAALVLPGLVLGGWIALHQVDDLGPWAADLGREVIGDDNVAELEELAYGLQDRVMRAVHAGGAPRAHWDSRDAAPARVEAPNTEAPNTEALLALGAANVNDPSISDPSISAAGFEECAEPIDSPLTSDPAEALPKTPAARPRAFRPAHVGPMYPQLFAEGDGRWVSADAGLGIAYKTLLHPDPERSYAELFIVALDLQRVDLHVSAGTLEPLNVAPGSDRLERTGLVPRGELDQLFGAFNGGFKTRHGGFGMHTQGVTLVPAREHACTIARYADGNLRIDTWSSLPDQAAIEWYRQTPDCMVRSGVRHPSLADSKSWGATVDGDTVIRRSAVGLSADHKTLFVAISNATHADALAKGLEHVGAAHVAQLDVNHSYPRFLFFGQGSRGEHMTPLAEGFVVKPGHYVNTASKRDFFYLTHKRDRSLAQSDQGSPERGG